MMDEEPLVPDNGWVLLTPEQARDILEEFGIDPDSVEFVEI
jgi:hypothetical protein